MIGKLGLCDQGMDLLVTNAVQQGRQFAALRLWNQVMGLQMVAGNHSLAQRANGGGLFYLEWDRQERFSFDFAQGTGPLLLLNH